MTLKSLIIYSSWTGNTEKVAKAFKNVFEKKGWECDIFKIDKKTDVDNPPFDYRKYDFVCLGSPIGHKRLPAPEMMNLMNVMLEKIPHRVIVPGPKKGIVFATYSGVHLGPKEPLAVLSYLKLQLEHMKYICVGEFACPGRSPHRKDNALDLSLWYPDISSRPNKRDLQKAEIFLEEKIEDTRL